MYLKNILIKNFRQFGHFEVQLNSGLNILIGENNSGKTTLIDAIRLTLDTNSSEWVYLQESDFKIGETELHIQLMFDGLTDYEAGIFAEHLNHEQQVQGTDEQAIKRKHVLYVNLLASLTSLTSTNSRFLKTDVRSGKNAEGGLIEKEIRKYLEVTYLKPLRDAENELSAGRNSRLSQILLSPNCTVSRNETTENLISVLVEANNQIKADKAIQQTSAQIKMLLQKVIFATDDFEPIINMLGTKPFVQLSESEKRIVFKSILEKLALNLSDDQLKHGMGYNNLLFMVTELMLLTGESGISSPLLLVEEPEAHLHPQLQMKFLQYIQKQQENISDNKTTDNAQVNSQAHPHTLQCILSTHSPNLASKAALNSLIIMHKGIAYPLRQGMTKLDSEDYIFLEKFLDATKSNMFFAKGILIVEGDAENILLPTIAELLGTPLEDYGIAVVNVGHKGYKRFARIYQKGAENTSLPLPIKVACLTDLDLWPNEAEEKPENPFGFIKRKLRDDATGKRGNETYWESFYDDAARKAHINKKKDDDCDYVKTFVSDVWTFEYNLILSGLESEIYQALIGNTDEEIKETYKQFCKECPDPTERAVKLYSQISGLKTDLSYKLIPILQRTYQNKPENLREKLPQYIQDAFKHVMTKDK